METPTAFVIHPEVRGMPLPRGAEVMLASDQSVVKDRQGVTPLPYSYRVKSSCR